MRSPLLTHAKQRKPLRIVLLVILVGSIVVALPVINMLLFRTDTRERRRAVADEIEAAKLHILNKGESAEAIAKIRKAARSEFVFERMYAIAAIGELGPFGKSAMPELIDALGAEKQIIVRTAAISAKKLGPDASEAVPSLIDLLRREGLDVSWFAAEALGEMGTDALVAVPELRRASESSDANLRECASAALLKLLGAAKRPE